MSARITNFISGACFGHWEEGDDSCKKCRACKSCCNATLSSDADDIRRSFKTTKKFVEKLIDDWNPDRQC